MADVHTDLVLIYLFDRATTVVDVEEHCQLALAQTQTSKLTAT
jgi:hypothetical protein